MTAAPDPPVALVPFRSPGRGKTRLAPGLDERQRADLAAAMLADVVAALRAAPIDRVLVLAGGVGAEKVARSLGVDVLRDPRGGGLDVAVAAATRRLGRRASSLVVMGDLPRLTATDVVRLLAHEADVVVAPTDDGGTGALLRRPSDAIATAYGPGSAARHLGLGRDRGLSTAVSASAGFRHDVDTSADLALLRAGVVGPRTAAVVRRLDAEAVAPDLRRTAGPLSPRPGTGPGSRR